MSQPIRLTIEVAEAYFNTLKDREAAGIPGDHMACPLAMALKHAGAPYPSVNPVFYWLDIMHADRERQFAEAWVEPFIKRVDRIGVHRNVTAKTAKRILQEVRSPTTP